MGATIVKAGTKRRRYTLHELDTIVLPQVRKVSWLVDDVILLLLYADARHPIEGKARIMLQVYLALREILPERDTEDVQFERKRSGMDSEDVALAVDSLTFSNRVEIAGESVRDCLLSITPRGRARIAPRFDALPTATREMLAQKRHEWDTLTPAGLRRYADALGQD